MLSLGQPGGHGLGLMGAARRAGCVIPAVVAVGTAGMKNLHLLDQHRRHGGMPEIMPLRFLLGE